MRAVRFLYWNTGKKAGSLQEVLAHVLATDAPPDVLLLGECLTGLTAEFMQQHGYELMPYTPMEREKPTQQVYFKPQANLHLSHLSTDVDYEVEDEPPVPGVSPPYRFLETEPDFVARVVLLQLVVEGEPTLVASVHLPSRRYGAHDEASQLGVVGRYKNFIAQAAGQPLAEFGYRITVVGDFNMNPFDLGMLQPTGFNALNSRAFVRRTRDFVYVPELMFYNPCWALLSDIDPLAPQSPRLPGSLYFGGAPSKKLYWHLFDQVVLSYDLMDRLDVTTLRIVPYEPLRKERERGADNARYSDHLPLCFTLQLGTHVS